MVVRLDFYASVKPRLAGLALAFGTPSQSQSQLQANRLAWLGFIKPWLWLLGFLA
jgi:hypothetical protein